MKVDRDFASEFLNIIDEETKKILGEDKAKELRKNINQKLKAKGLDIIKWEDD